MNKYIRFKDNQKRVVVVNEKFEKFSLKYLSLRETLSFNLKFKTMLKLQKLNSLVKVKNRCILSNYSRALVCFTQTSKAEFRKNMSLGLVTGFRKSS